MNNEAPTYVQKKKELGNWVVEYRDLTEVCQGGPEIGHLFVDGQPLKKNWWFGGPSLFNEKTSKLYIPRYKRTFFSSGFNLCEIDLDSLEIREIGVTRNVIFLEKVADGKVWFHTDLNKESRDYESLETL